MQYIYIAFFNVLGPRMCVDCAISRLAGVLNQLASDLQWLVGIAHALWTSHYAACVWMLQDNAASTNTPDIAHQILPARHAAETSHNAEMATVFYNADTNGGDGTKLSCGIRRRYRDFHPTHITQNNLAIFVKGKYFFKAA